MPPQLDALNNINLMYQNPLDKKESNILGRIYIIFFFFGSKQADLYATKLRQNVDGN